MVNNNNKKKSTTKRSYKRKSYNKKSNYKDIEKVFKKMILKKAESKEITTHFGKTEMYHNDGYYKKFNDTTHMPSQGTADNQRIGDQINVGGFYVRLLCGQKFDRPNCTWIFHVLKIPKASAINYNTLFNSYTNNCLLDNPNKDLVTVLKSFTIKKYFSPLTDNGDGNYSLASKEVTFPVKIWIPYKKLYKFQTDGALTHNDNDLYLVAFVYDAYGTLLTDNIGYIQHVSTMYYKDP